MFIMEDNQTAEPTLFDLQNLEKFARNRTRAEIPVFHLVLVMVSVLLICCSIFTAIGVYLRVLHLSRRQRRRKRRRAAAEAEEGAAAAVQPLRVAVDEC